MVIFRLGISRNSKGISTDPCPVTPHSPRKKAPEVMSIQNGGGDSPSIAGLYLTL